MPCHPAAQPGSGSHPRESELQSGRENSCLSSPAGGSAVPAQADLRLPGSASLHPSVQRTNGHSPPGIQSPACISQNILLGLRNSDFPLPEPVFGSSFCGGDYVLKTQVLRSWVCHVLEPLSFLIWKMGTLQMRKLRPSLVISVAQSHTQQVALGFSPRNMTPEPNY